MNKLIPIVLLSLASMRGLAQNPVMPPLVLDEACEHAEMVVIAVEACYEYTDVGKCILSAQDLFNRLQANVFIERYCKESKSNE